MQKYFFVSTILLLVILAGCTQTEIKQEKVNNITNVLNSIAELQNVQKPTFVNASKVNMIRLVYSFNGQDLIIYTDENYTKIIGLTPGKEENVSDIIKQLSDIKKQIEEQKNLSSSERYVNNKIREIESAAFKGNDNASVIVIEFSDFQCPFCKAFFDQTEKQFEQIYVDRGLVKFYYAHLPLEQIHAQAMPAANAAECAKEQGKFWQYHDALFSNQSQLSDTTYEKIASDLGLDVDKWKQCYNEKKYLNVINEHTQIAYSFYASGTPTFVIFNKNGLSQSKKEQLKSINMAYAANTGQPLFQLVTDGDNSAVVISGALPITVFQQIIDIVR